MNAGLSISLSFNCNFIKISNESKDKELIVLWVVGSGDGAGYLPVPGRPTTLAYGRAGAYCACSRCETGALFFIFFFISSILSSFSNASSVEKRLDILKYCGLGRYNPAVVVSYFRRHAR